MTDGDLIGYLLELLDPDDRAAVVADIVAHPETAVRLEQLRDTVARLKVDHEPAVPRPGLAVRTVARLAEHLVASGHRQPTGDETPASDLLTALTGQPAGTAPAPRPALPKAPAEWAEARFVGGRFRADLVVAAGIGLVVVGLVLSGVSRLRYQNDLMACQKNLQALHNGLAGYADNHEGRFPQVGVDRYPTAGTFVAALADAGQFPAEFSPVCPASVRSADVSRVGYAYTLGHVAPGGGILGLRRATESGEENDLLPIAADCPAAGLVAGAGPVCPHGRSMGVLYVGGNVRTTTLPTVGPNGDDIYRNRLGQVSAGVDRTDAVLGRTADRP